MHHLAKCEEDIHAGDTNFKTYPPIRQKAALNLLWDCLKLDTIDNVVSGHSKICPRYKFREVGEFNKAIPGIDGIGF
jgi:dihydroorotase-like cyclic amidohydrolase